MVFNKTRIAPTPSGFLHLGNILSFSITAALAKKTGASILLRIDDLDRDRTTETYIRDIFETLDYLEIPWDEGPSDAGEFEREYSQHHRLPLYRGALQHLQEAAAVFACACSRSQLLGSGSEGRYPGTCRDLGLPLSTPGTNWRLRTPDTVTIRFRPYPDGSATAVLPEQMHDFVVRKKDGFPAYQLTSLIDDLHYGVDLIVRGNDLLPSTLAQLYLSRVLDTPAFCDSTFYHHALLHAPSGLKLSKSAGDTSVRYLRLQGLKPAAVYSQIAAHLDLGQPDTHLNLRQPGTHVNLRQPAAHLDLRQPVRNWEELAALALAAPAISAGSPRLPHDPHNSHDPHDPPTPPA